MSWSFIPCWLCWKLSSCKGRKHGEHQKEVFADILFCLYRVTDLVTIRTVVSRCHIPPSPWSQQSTRTNPLHFPLRPGSAREYRSFPVHSLPKQEPKIPFNRCSLEIPPCVPRVVRYAPREGNRKWWQAFSSNQKSATFGPHQDQSYTCSRSWVCRKAQSSWDWPPLGKRRGSGQSEWRPCLQDVESTEEWCATVSWKYRKAISVLQTFTHRSDFSFLSWDRISFPGPV